MYGTAVFLYWMGLYIYTPTLPVYAETKANDLALVGVALSMYGLWQAIVRIPLGVVVDSVGRRKPFLLVGFGLAALGAWIMGTAGDINALIIGRAITGLAAGTWLPLVVVFSALFPADETVQATSLLTMIASAGRMLATSLTGPLNEWGGYPAAFFVSIGTAGLAALFILPAQETRHAPIRPSAGGIVGLMRRRDVLLPALLNAIIQYVIWTTSYGFVPLLAKQLGAGDVFIGLLVTLNLGVVTAGNLAATTLVGRLGTYRLMVASFVLLSLSVSGAALAPNLTVLLLAQAAIGLAQGVGYPVLMGLSIRYVKDTQRTIAMGIHQSVYAVAMFAGPWLGGILADVVGIRPMFGVTAFACLALGLLGAHQLTASNTA